MVASEHKLPGNRRPVRACVTTTASGAVERRLVVLCRERGAVIPFEECADCGRCDGWVLDPDREESFVVCHPECDVETEPDGAPVDTLEVLLATPVREIMTLGAHCVTADVPLEAVRALFVEENISGAPVVDERGRPIGVVSKTDLVRAAPEAAAHVVVRDVMTPLCFTLAEKTPLGHAAALMAYEGIHRAPVLDSTGQVAGMLSSFDVLRFLAESADPAPLPPSETDTGTRPRQRRTT